MHDVAVFEGPRALIRALEEELGPDGVAELHDLDAGDHDLVLVPLEVATIRRAHAGHPGAAIVAFAVTADAHTAREAIEAGANDLLVLGPELALRVGTLLHKLRPWTRLRRHHALLEGRLAGRWSLLGETRAMRELRAAIRRVATIPRPVLVVGERGTGKELVARALHDQGANPRGPMVTLNCAAFQDPLLESEIFGHERGAFSGADQRKIGRFEQADGGTLFLDEVALMSLPFQQKMLRAVEYGTFQRLGGGAERHATVRVVGATNADLGERVREGSFLPDLLDRLAFEVITVPPLRERREDVAHLAMHFLEAFRAEVPSVSTRSFSASALAALEAYPFPGNVRELKHVVERAATRASEGPIEPDDLGLPPPALPAIGAGYEEQVRSFERSVLTRALEASGGNRAAAARRLDLTYDQLRHQLRRHGLR